MRSWLPPPTLVDTVRLAIGAELLEIIQFGREMLPADASVRLEASLLSAVADLCEDTSVE